MPRFSRFFAAMLLIFHYYFIDDADTLRLIAAITLI